MAENQAKPKTNRVVRWLYAPLNHIATQRPISAVGYLLAAAFFGASLTPSLMPRDAWVQGLLAGFVALLGYVLGHTLQWIWEFLEIPQFRELGRKICRWAAIIVSVVIVLGSLGKAAEWQNATRAVVGLQPVATTQPIIVLLVAVAVFGMLWLLILAFRLVLLSAQKQLKRFVPRRVSALVAFCLALWVFWALGEGILARSFFRSADSFFESADRFIEPSIPEPTNPLHVGSPSSDIEWEEVGRWGRDYIHRTPGRDEIREFYGEEAMEPVRVYVGLRAAPTPRERAELALKEFKRLGGFDRKAIVVMVPVGTGWMDPGGQETMEFMLGGNVATVAVQYSYLKAALSVLADSDVGNEQSRILFDLIYEHWSQMPRDSRPKFYVHGLSQGSEISQNTLPILDFLGDPIDGVLWAGSPFFSPFWKTVRDSRDPESPIWQPKYGNGSLVRVANQHTGLEQYDAPWGPLRIVFLNYGSDPIVHFTYDIAYRCPDWLKEPRAYDVAPEFRWFPLVTMLQVGLDTTISLEAPGHGHYYVAEDYIDAWAEVLDPPGWDESRSETLKEIFVQRGPAF